MCNLFFLSRNVTIVQCRISPCISHSSFSFDQTELFLTKDYVHITEKEDN